MIVEFIAVLNVWVFCSFGLCAVLFHIYVKYTFSLKEKIEIEEV